MSNADRGPWQVAQDVYRLTTGHGALRVNVYLVRADDAWALVDTAWGSSAAVIRSAAERLFGRDARPAAILLTHIHPDHSGAALELARAWDRPVSVHADEVPLASGGIVAEYANPLDRRVIAPILRLMPAARVEAQRVAASLEPVIEALPAGGDVPALPGWRAVPTPGHTPGHVAFFREHDRVLLTGDAVLTVNPASLSGLLLDRHRLTGPPTMSTWRRAAATASVSALAALRPAVLASGHGSPMTGPGLGDALEALATRL